MKPSCVQVCGCTWACKIFNFANEFTIRSPGNRQSQYQYSLKDILKYRMHNYKVMKCFKAYLRIYKSFPSHPHTHKRGRVLGKRIKSSLRQFVRQSKEPFCTHLGILENITAELK